MSTLAGPARRSRRVNRDVLVERLPAALAARLVLVDDLAASEACMSSTAGFVGSSTA